MRYRTDNERFMAKAISQAKKGIGYTSPNPAVGCVIVKDGEIIAEAYHHRAGLPHAEVLALSKAKDNARNADIYVTLEPCCTHGKTPPCTDALIAAGVKRVIIGTYDPNPRVNGCGAQKLKDAGIEVVMGVLESECRELNPGYNKYITTGLPFVTLKFAQSLDGRIATKTGSSQWISSDDSLKLAHKLRASHDAILVGANTANTDNPRLTVRRTKGNNPTRLVLSKSGNLKENLSLLNDNQAPTIVITSGENLDKVRRISGAHVEVIAITENGTHFDLDTLLRNLAAKGITSILVEGGSMVITSLIKNHLADRAVIISAPIFLGEGISSVGDLQINNVDNAIKLTNIKRTYYGPDCAIMGDLN